MSLVINGTAYNYINDEVAKLLNYNFSGMDLSGVTIHGLSQSANFQGANLTGATFDGLFSNSNFCMAVIKNVIFEQGTKFVGCDFNGAIAHGTALIKYVFNSFGAKEAVKRAAVAVLEEPINFGQNQASQILPEIAMQATTSLTNKWPAIAAWTAAGIFGAYVCNKLWHYYSTKGNEQELEIPELESVLVEAATEATNLELPQDEEEPKKKTKKPKNKKRKREEKAEELEIEQEIPEMSIIDDEDLEAPAPKRVHVADENNNNNLQFNDPLNDMEVDGNPIEAPELTEQDPEAPDPIPIAPENPVKSKVSRGGSWRELAGLLENYSPTNSTRSRGK